MDDRDYIRQLLNPFTIAAEARRLAEASHDLVERTDRLRRLPDRRRAGTLATFIASGLCRPARAVP